MWLTKTLQLMILVTTIHQTIGQCEGVESSDVSPSMCLDNIESTINNVEVSDAIIQLSASSSDIPLLLDSDVFLTSTGVYLTPTELVRSEESSIPLQSTAATVTNLPAPTNLPSPTDLPAPTSSLVPTTSIFTLELDTSLDMNFELLSELDAAATSSVEQLVVMATNAIDSQLSIPSDTSTVDILIETSSVAPVIDPVLPSATTAIELDPFTTSQDSLQPTPAPSMTPAPSVTPPPSTELSSSPSSSMEPQITSEMASLLSSQTLLSNPSPLTALESSSIQPVLPSEAISVTLSQSSSMPPLLPSEAISVTLSQSSSMPPLLPSEAISVTLSQSPVPTSTTGQNIAPSALSQTPLPTSSTSIIASEPEPTEIPSPVQSISASPTEVLITPSLSAPVVEPEATGIPVPARSISTELPLPITPSSPIVKTLLSASPLSTSFLPGPLETVDPTSTPILPVTTSVFPATTIAEETILQTIINALTIQGLAGVAAGAGIILILTCILCCCCCCVCCCRSRSKKTLEFADSGYSYENKNASEMYPLPNGGVSGTGYHGYSHGSGLDLHSHHHYESAADVNAYKATQDDINYGGDHSQVASNLQGSQALAHSQPLHHSQPYHHSHHHSLSHHHSQASALTDVFQKTTLPELSPMSYSLTANPVHSENFYMNTLPASNVSLREPTMFALSLQQEESKSAQGSRLSMTGSKTSIHGSRPSVYGSKASNIHGSRPMVYNSGTSRESLLGLRGGAKEHNVDDEVELPLPSLLLHHRVSSPSLPPPTSSTENMELPTRDSPRPQLASFALSSSHNKKDFASLTCLTDNPRRAISPISPTHTNPSPLESPMHSDVEPSTSVHRKLTKRKDLSSLTSLDFMSGPTTGKENRGGTIIEEEESSQSSKVNSDKAKDDSPAIKKTRSKRLSRLEKLTSLDYIRQSFRLKKKKVSFEQSSGETPKTVSRKNSAPKNRHHGDTTITNEHAHRQHDNEVAGAERVRGKLEWHQARRNSSTSTDMFSPTENIARNMYIQHHHHAFPDTHAAMAMSYTPQLSQPNYYLPAHMPGAPPGVPGIPLHPHIAQQLSQQYYPSQLSQGYAYPTHHVPIGDPVGRGFAREMPPNGGRADPRYHEVITPDYSDITTPEHDPNRRQRRISIDEEYDLRDHFNRRADAGRYVDAEDTSPTNHTPDIDTEAHTYRDVRPDYVNGHHGHIHSGGHYMKDHVDMMTSPQRHAAAHMPTHRRGGRHPDPLGEEPGLGGRYGPPVMDLIPEDMYQNSISVDDPPSPVGPDSYHHPHTSPHTSPRMERRRSDYSDTSERHFNIGSSTRATGGNKGHVSWNTTVSYAPEEDEGTELSRL